MILVADSGSSKTDWILYNTGQNIEFSTVGINPYFLNDKDVTRIMSHAKEIQPYAERVKEIYFFGAGCSSPDKREIVSNGLSVVFNKAYISVDSDLVGCAFASCGSSKGLSCILGTGSNISYFDGTDIRANKNGLGFILGDEGSGSYFGKRLITDHLYGNMPKHLQEAFQQAYKADKEIIIKNIYQKPAPNTYLASFSRFISKHLTDPYILALLDSGFKQFIDTNIKLYPEHKEVACNFVGSIAWHFRERLTMACEREGIMVGKILHKPIYELQKFILKREGVLM